MMELNNSRGRIGAGAKHYMPGLDGLRALAVIAVIAYHLDLPGAAGGFLGVGIFFTLSGYLITDQLIAQWQNTGRIDVKSFWRRRLQRIMPAVLFLLLIIYLWLASFDRPRLGAFASESVSVLLCFSNWWQIFHKVSYFENFGPPSPIGHLWSLGIEAQFYLLWPIVVSILLHFKPRRGRLIFLTFLGSAASITAMALIYRPGADPSRVYYGTDTRLFALLIGAMFAVAFPSRGSRSRLSVPSFAMLDTIGAACMLGIALMILRTNEYDSYLYTGGLALFSLMSAIAIVVLTYPSSRLAKVIGCEPLRWIGAHSYSLYLWHYPVIILTSPNLNTEGPDPVRIILQVALSFVLAALSQRYIEDPIRDGSFGRQWKNRNPKPLNGTAGNLRRRCFPTVAGIAALLLFIISCTSHTNGGNTRYRSSSPDVGQVQQDTSAAQTGAASSATETQKSAANITEKPSADESSNQVSGSQRVESGKGITAIGDSIMLDAAPYLEKFLPGICIDGKVGRQMSEAGQVISRLRKERRLGGSIIIELGSNGSFSKKQLRELLESLKDMDKVILVSVRVPKKWQDTVNSDLKSTAPEFPNVTLVDWFSASRGKNALFGKDGVHLTRTGADYYASLLAEAARKGAQ